jgi:hypothetical protein
MKLTAITINMICGTVLMLAPMIFAQEVAHAYFIAAQLVGGTMCSAGIGMCFVLINPPQVQNGRHPVAA